MDKDVLYIHSGVQLNHKEILPFAIVWMGIENVMLSEVSQRKTNTIYYYLYVESKK